MSDVSSQEGSRSSSPIFEPEEPSVQHRKQQKAAEIPVTMMIPVKPDYDTETTTNSADTSTSPSILQLQNIKVDAQQSVLSMKKLKPDHTKLTNAATPFIPKKRKASEIGTDITDIDEGEEDDDDGCVPPHDPQLEPLPRLPVYHPAFELVEDTSRKMLKTFRQFIENSGYTDAEAKHLMKDIQAHSKIPYGDAVRIGLIGDAGVGKSSAINSILGVANLTVEGDDGDSCTYVVIEFVSATGTQMQPFATEVEFFAQELCEKMITELLAQWVRHHQKCLDDSAELDEMDTENAATARECFQELFSAYPEFKNEESAEIFLSTAVAPNNSDVLKKLLKYTRDILHMFISDGKSTLNLGSDTAEGLVEKFIPFTRKVSYASFRGKDLKFSPWPLVRLVRVSLHSPILSQGIILADLPGVSDINRFRVDAANRYMQTCDVTIVVAKIDRPEKNIHFKRQYMDAYRRRRSGSVIIVITRSDDLNLAGKTNIEFGLQDEERLAVVTQNATALDKKFEENRVMMEKNKASGKASLNKKLREQNHKLSQRKKALAQERLEIRIVARNKKFAAVLKNNYRADTRDENTVPVFCISNKAYMQHIRGYEKAEPPAMGLAETQIPSMRAHIYARPSKGKFSTLEHYHRTSLHTLLSIIQMSCSTTTIARKEHLVSIVKQSKDEMIKQIDVSLKKFHDGDVAELAGQLSMKDQNSLHWIFERSARALCRKLSQLPAQGHRAFIRNNGTYKTKKIPAACWNEEFLAPLKDGIDRIFAKIHDEACETFKAEMSQVLKEIMTSLNQKLKNDPQALVCNAYKDCFLRNLEAYNNEISGEVSNFMKNLQKDFRTIHVKTATDGYTKNNKHEDVPHYFTAAMLPIYNQSNISLAKRGSTLHKSRCATFESLVCAAESPFQTTTETVQKKCKIALSNNGNQLKSKISGILDKIQSDFARMSTKKDNDTPEGQKFRAELHAMVKMAREILDEPVLDALELCRQYK